MARTLGVYNLNEITTIRAFVSYIQFMNKEMNIPLNISSIGTISESEYMAKIEFMAEAALRDACTATNPRVPTKAEVVDMYKKLW